MKSSTSRIQIHEPSRITLHNNEREKRLLCLEGVGSVQTARRIIQPPLWSSESVRVPRWHFPKKRAWSSVHRKHCLGCARSRIPNPEIACLRICVHTGWKQTNRIVRPAYSLRCGRDKGGDVKVSERRDWVGIHAGMERERYGTGRKKERKIDGDRRWTGMCVGDAGVDTVVVPMVVPVAVPVTRSNDQGFGKRNRSNPAPQRTTPYASYLPSSSPSLHPPPPSGHAAPAGPVAGRALAIYCPHSAGSQHKYVTPMATPTGHSSRIPPQASGRTAKRITRISG